MEIARLHDEIGRFHETIAQQAQTIERTVAMLPPASDQGEAVMDPAQTQVESEECYMRRHRGRGVVSCTASR